MKPMLDPKRGLRGATLETLAKALFRRMEPLTSGAEKAVVGNQVAIQEVSTDYPGNGISHLDEGS